MRFGLSIAVLLATAFATPVAAENIVGNAVVGGKRVQLMGDNTWRFIESENATCVPLTNEIEFCGSILDWTPTRSANPDAVAMYRHGDSLFAMFIPENLGSDSGMSAEFMRNAVLGFAAEESGVMIENVPVYDIQDVELDGKPGETIIYGSRTDGLPVVLANSIIITPGLTLQAITLSVNTEYTDEHQSLHANFVENTRLDIPEASY